MNTEEENVLTRADADFLIGHFEKVRGKALSQDLFDAMEGSIVLVNSSVGLKYREINENSAKGEIEIVE